MDDNKDYSEKLPGAEGSLNEKHEEEAMPAELISAGSEHLHRKLGGKEIQLFAVGGAIGTCMASSATLKVLLIFDPFAD